MTGVNFETAAKRESAIAMGIRSATVDAITEGGPITLRVCRDAGQRGFLCSQIPAFCDRCERIYVFSDGRVERPERGS